MDNSDFQYAGFRKNIPILFATMTGHLVFTHISRSLFGKAHTGSVRLICSLVFSLCFLFVLYGTHLIKIILTVSFAYLITKNTRGSILNPILIWIYSLTILFLSDRYHNFKFGSVMNILSFLDDMGGLQPSWWGPFNFLILKMISFSMDYYYRFDVDGEWWGKLRVKKNNPTSLVFLFINHSQFIHSFTHSSLTDKSARNAQHSLGSGVLVLESKNRFLIQSTTS